MSLNVFMGQTRIGTLFPAGEGDYRFAYEPSTVAREGAGSQLLSTALPVRLEPYTNEATRTYIDGLLPDGRLRVQIARALSLDSSDSFGLLAELGGDCPGAVRFQISDKPIEPDPASVRWLSEDELAEVISGRPATSFAHPDPEVRLRQCLPGIHFKVALVRDEANDRWGIPGPAAPSTHIVKPETGEFPDLVANEYFCMEVARAAGVRVADTEYMEICGQPCLVSKRFDRVEGKKGVERIHQEDLCQALGCPPASAGWLGDVGEGPGFSETTGLLKAVGQPGDVGMIVTAGFCNYVLGNGEAHGKNFALVSRRGRRRLAPIYDVTSTAIYESPVHIGMVINEEYDETAYLIELAQMSEECGYDFEVFRRLASVTAGKISEAIDGITERSRTEGWYAPIVDQIAEMAGERAFGLGVEVEY